MATRFFGYSGKIKLGRPEKSVRPPPPSLSALRLLLEREVYARWRRNE